MKGFKYRYIIAMMDVILLRYLKEGNLHMYGMITKLRSEYGILLDTSQIKCSLGRLLLLGAVEREKIILGPERPCIPYRITSTGLFILKQGIRDMKIIVEPFIEHLDQELASQR